MYERVLIAVLMENITLVNTGNWTFPSNTTGSLVTHTAPSDNESMNNYYYTIVLVGLGLVIYALIWLRRKRNREKYLQKREKEYLEYYHKILPQSRIYGDIADTNNIETMVKSFHGVKGRAISIQHGLASIAGLVINVNQKPDNEMEEKVDDRRHSDSDELDISTEEYREFTNPSSNDKASIQIHYDGIEDMRNDVYSQSDISVNELHNEKSNNSHDDMKCEMIQYNVNNSLGAIYDESEHEIEKERTSNKVRCEVRSEITSKEQRIPNRGHRKVHGDLLGKIPCAFQDKMRRSTEKLPNIVHRGSESEIHSVSRHASKDKMMLYDNNTHRQNTDITISNAKQRYSRTELELNSPLYKSLSEGDDDVFMITEYTNNSDCITGTNKNLTMADIHIDFPHESEAFSVLNKPQYATNTSPVSKWQKDRNLNAVHYKSDVKSEYELDKYERRKNKQVNGLHLTRSNTCNGKLMGEYRFKSEEEFSGHKTIRNKLKSHDSFLEDYVRCTWI